MIGMAGISLEQYLQCLAAELWAPKSIFQCVHLLHCSKSLHCCVTDATEHRFLELTDIHGEDFAPDLDKSCNRKHTLMQTLRHKSVIHQRELFEASVMRVLCDLT